MVKLLGGTMDYIKDGLIEAGRVIVLAIIPVVISGLENNAINWRTIMVVGAIALLRFIDKALHLKGVEEQNENLTKGLTRF
jgi:hypothetical protein